MATGGVLNGLSKGASLIKGLNSLGEAGKAVAAVVQASALNQAEGIQSAIGVYDTTYQEKLKLYANQENAEDLARQDAAAAAIDESAPADPAVPRLAASTDRQSAWLLGSP